MDGYIQRGPMEVLDNYIRKFDNKNKLTMKVYN